MDYTFRTERAEQNRRSWGLFAAIGATLIIAIVLIARRGRDTETQQPEEVSNAVTAATVPTVTTSQKQIETSVYTQTLPPAPAEKMKPASAEVNELLAQGQEAERADDLSAARSFYEQVLASPDCGDARPLAESRLGAVFVNLIFSQREMAEKVDHAIVSGDLIQKLANRYNTTALLIAKANRLSNPNNINVGDRLRILKDAKFAITVSKSQNWLLVTMNGKFFKRYIVGTGKYNRTPIGTFRITQKIENPSWWKDNKEIPFGDKENILGTRWMRIEATGSTPPAAGYGIHGTWDDASLGHQSSAGCVRMANADVEELFIYIPQNTAVTIIE